MTGFDPIKALKEEVAGLSDVAKALAIRERSAEKIVGEAESELNALKKLRGFADAELARKRAVLEQLIAQQERGS